jgi:hypothetical protein
MSSKTPYILAGGAALAALGIYLFVKSKPTANANKAAPAPIAPIPRVSDPAAWTPPVGFPQLPAGFTIPAGALPPAGWIPPISWQPPAGIALPNWIPGQPIPGIPALPPLVAPGTPTVPAVSPGPRGAAVPTQRAYALGADDGGPVGWSIPEVPSSVPFLTQMPAIPGLPIPATVSAPKSPPATPPPAGVVTDPNGREMTAGDKVEMWQAIFGISPHWIDYCYEPSKPCLAAHVVTAEPYVKGRGNNMAYEISFLNDTDPPRGNYENPGWTVLYSPSQEMFWLLPDEKARVAATTDDWTLFLRPNEYRLVQARAGADFSVPDDAGSTQQEKQGLTGYTAPSFPGFGQNIPFPNIPGIPNPYPDGIPGFGAIGSGGGVTPSTFKLPGM